MKNRIILGVWLGFLSIGITNGSFAQEFPLPEVDTARFIPEALAIHTKAQAVIAEPNNHALHLEFIDTFPDNFNVFLKIFNAPEFDQLYSDSYVYIELLGELASEHPEEAAPKIVKLAGNGCFTADAPNYFRKLVREFMARNEALFDAEYEKLSGTEQETFTAYLNASFHPHNGPRTGFCEKK